jgi:hypothetical protein
VLFPVEIRISDHDEKALTARMMAMREWLDHRRFEPSTFRYTFQPPGLHFRIDFSKEEEAAAFADQFGGRMLSAALDGAD